MRDKSLHSTARMPAQGSLTPAQIPPVCGPEKPVRSQNYETRPNGPPKSYRLHRKQAAVHLGVSLSWLDKARMVGRGPAFIAIGSRVVYDLADLDAFLRQNRHEADFGP